MKVNIQKLQQGGGFATFTPIVSSAPIARDKGTTAAVKASEGIMDDDIFKNLLDKGGLTNDVNAFANELIQLQSQQTPFTSGANRSRAIYLLSKVNALKESKTNWENAIKTATSEGGLGEVAVGSSGEVFTKDRNNNVRAISLRDYIENRENVKLLSVSELMRERSLNPNLVGQDQLFDVANNAVGLKKISDHIQNIVKELGTESITETTSMTKEEAAARRRSLGASAEDQKNVATLQKVLDSPTGMAEIKTSIESERGQLKKALDYIWGTLGQQAQMKLSAVAAMNGEKNPQSYIAKMLEFGTSYSTTTEVTPKEIPGEKESTKSLTEFQMVHKDKLANVNNTFAMNDPKMASMFRGIIGGVSPVILADGEQVGPTTVQNILTAGYGKFLQGDKVFFGNKKVSAAELQHIVYDGQDGAKVYMPVDHATGGPDYDSLAKFKETYNVWEANKDKWTKGYAEKYFMDHGSFKVQIEEKYEDGKKIQVIKNGTDVKPFWVMYGYTNDDTDLVQDNEKWLTEMKGQDEDVAKSVTESVWKVTDAKGKVKMDFTPSGKWLNLTDYYKGMVAIPYRNEAAAIVDAMVGQGPKEKTSSIVDVQRTLKQSSGQPLSSETNSLRLTK